MMFSFLEFLSLNIKTHTNSGKIKSSSPLPLRQQDLCKTIWDREI